jgi:hypothetical protein
VPNGHTAAASTATHRRGQPAEQMARGLGGCRHSTGHACMSQQHGAAVWGQRRATHGTAESRAQPPLGLSASSRPRTRASAAAQSSHSCTRGRETAELPGGSWWHSPADRARGATSKSNSGGAADADADGCEREHDTAWCQPVAESSAGTAAWLGSSAVPLQVFSSRRVPSHRPATRQVALHPVAASGGAVAPNVTRSASPGEDNPFEDWRQVNEPPLPVVCCHTIRTHLASTESRVE